MESAWWWALALVALRIIPPVILSTLTPMLLKPAIPKPSTSGRYTSIQQLLLKDVIHSFCSKVTDIAYTGVYNALICVCRPSQLDLAQRIALHTCSVTWTRRPLDHRSSRCLRIIGISCRSIRSSSHELFLKQAICVAAILHRSTQLTGANDCQLSVPGCKVGGSGNAKSVVWLLPHIPSQVSFHVGITRLSVISVQLR